MINKFLTSHPALTFFWMLLSALAFGLSSYNIFHLFHENIDLVIEYGIMALKDGAFVQLLMLIAYGVISLATYIIFKACEKVMVEYTLGNKK